MDGVGRLIERWIAEGGGSQTDLSDLVGVSQKTISRWKNEETLPQPEVHPQLANALGTNERALLAAIEVTKHHLQTARRQTVFAREGFRARPERDMAAWVSAVMQDGELPLLTRAALALFPRFVEIPQTLQAFVTPRDLVNLMPEITEENIDEIWAEVLSSGYVRPLSPSGRVFDLVTRPEP